MYRLVEDVLEVPAFEEIRRQVETTTAVRSGIPGLRQGGAVSGSVLVEAAPACLNLYRDPAFLQLVQANSAVGGMLQPLPPSMPHSCSLLIYERPGDSIAWHHDVNYFRGDTVTVLLTVLNRGKNGLCCSANRTCAVLGGVRSCRDTPENSALIMRGDRVLHAAEELAPGERRVVLSMVYTTDPSQTPWQVFRMALKDWSFFVSA